MTIRLSKSYTRFTLVKEIFTKQYLCSVSYIEAGKITVSFKRLIQTNIWMDIFNYCVASLNKFKVFLVGHKCS